jgi:hypothetical protein
VQVALQDFLPENFQLQFGKTISKAAMNAETKREVFARPAGSPEGRRTEARDRDAARDLGGIEGPGGAVDPR